MHVELEGELSAEGNLLLGLQQGEFLAGPCLWFPGRWGQVHGGEDREVGSWGSTVVYCTV